YALRSEAPCIGCFCRNLHRVGIVVPSDPGWPGDDPTVSAGGHPFHNCWSASLCMDSVAWGTDSFKAGMEKRGAAGRSAVSHLLWPAVLGGTASRLRAGRRAVRHYAALGDGI